MHDRLTSRAASTLSIRERLLLPYVHDRSVLDVGSVGQTSAYNLWEFLRRHASILTGIDTQPSSDPLVVRGNMEEHRFGRMFEVVVAGDLIEHLHNPGRFLNNVRDHLVPGGRMLLTTPNAKWWTVMIKPNSTHTMWHDRHTLQYLLKENGFTVERLQYYAGNKQYPWWLRLLLARQAMFVVAARTA